MNFEQKNLKIGIYSPYFHTFGGGERYILTIAENLSKDNEVFLFDNKNLNEKAKNIFNISLKRIHFLPNEIFRTKNLFKKSISLLNFDLFFYMTDGSIYFPFSKKNFLIIQSPKHIPDNNFINYIKLARWKIICYSDYMKRIIETSLNKRAQILPPAIDTNLFTVNNPEKVKIILSVGRFFPYPHDKKHNILIEVFKENYYKHFQEWRLVIAGGLTERGGEKIVNELRKMTEGYPIEVMINVSFSKLVNLYQKASLYWHAAGYGEDLKMHPEAAEHFGITTLEAMAAGCVPIVFDAGGQREIVDDSVNGFLWNTCEELVAKTIQLITNEDNRSQLLDKAILRSRDFSIEKFNENLKKIIN